jgi:hypothetical protein
MGLTDSIELVCSTDSGQKRDHNEDAMGSQTSLMLRIGLLQLHFSNSCFCRYFTSEGVASMTKNEAHVVRYLRQSRVYFY